MRKLGHGQSVVFCVPREIRTKINALLSHAEDKEIQVSDILIWSIKETWTMQKRGVQLWALQGRRHEKSHRLWTEFTNNEGVLSPSQAEQFPEDEAQTIFQRYRPRARKQEEDAALGADASDPITERLLDFGALECDAAALYEEQERELAPEIEAEREQQRPPTTTPAIHTLNANVKRFAVEGTLVPKSAAYMRAFASLSLTRPGKEFGVNKISPALTPNLLITEDFAQTVKLPTGVGVFHDLYLRPVQWVLVSRKQAGEEPLMMIVSPFEANHLMPIMAKGSQTTLHIYYPRVNPAFPSLDDLQLFSFPRKLDEPIPESLAVALNLFAGQLYFNDYAMYVAACKFLGLSWERAKDGEVLDLDGFILRGVDGRAGGESGFRKSPVKF
ncbi:hypothetical protein IMZ48_20490, partial [Candidatus Bathyarchaeota archaeon]|nr:hypothetical protein [Candidatus Bathyarchaeota archaeon]